MNILIDGSSDVLAEVLLDEAHSEYEVLAPEAKRGALTSAKKDYGDQLGGRCRCKSLNVESSNPTTCLNVLSVHLGVYLCYIWSFQSIDYSLCTQPKD